MPFQNTPLLDNFNRTDENPAVGWTTATVAGASAFQIISGEAAGVAVGEPAMSFINQVNLTADEEAAVIIRAVDNGAEDAGVLLRGNAAGNTFYRAGIVNEDGGWHVNIAKWIVGTPSVIYYNVIDITPVVGSQFGAMVIKSRITAYLDSAVIGAVDDFSIPTGSRVGIMIGSTIWRVDDFRAGSVASGESPAIGSTFNFFLRVG